MKAIATARHRRKRFDVLCSTRGAEAAMMTLPPGADSGEDMENEHAWAEQWLYVVSGTGTARVGKRSVALRAGTLLVIQKREPHRVRAGRSRLVTFNVYVPPAYGKDGEPLKGRAKTTARRRGRRRGPADPGPRRSPG